MSDVARHPDRPVGLQRDRRRPGGIGHVPVERAGLESVRWLLLEAGVRRLLVAQRHRARPPASTQRVARAGLDRRERERVVDVCELRHGHAVDEHRPAGHDPDPHRRTIAQARVILAAMPARAATARLRVRIRDGDGPPYEQLRDAIRRRIERGTLLPGDRLPPVRACADDLELAPNTVARAYRALEEEGWLVGRGRAGTFVSDRPPVDADVALARGGRRLPATAAALGVAEGGRDPRGPRPRPLIRPACSTGGAGRRTLLERMFDSLNPEQRAAATHGEGPLLIVAGAGTGKTTTLAARVACLLERGVRPERVLLLTFSRRAAREMLERAERQGGHRDAGRVWGGTFHAVANRLLRVHGRTLGLSPGFTVLDQSRRRRRDEPAARGARLRLARASVPAQGDARADPLAGRQRGREARRGDRAPLPVVHRRHRRHPRDLPRLRRAQARAADARLRRPAAVLEGPRRLAADRPAGRRDVRSHPGRRVPGHERAAGRHPRGDAARSARRRT